MRELMDKVDLLWTSPTERAERIWNLLQHSHLKAYGFYPEPWDLMCFAAEAMGKLAIGLNDPDLLSRVKPVVNWVYTAHYNHPQDFAGSADKVNPSSEESDAVQPEREHDHQDGDIPPGHGGGTENPDVAERRAAEVSEEDS